jgi:hypothetical protein
MFSEKVNQLVVTQIDFVNDAIENQVEEVTSAAAKLKELGLRVDQLDDDGNTLEEIANNTVDLAGSFGKFYGQLTEEERTKVKDAFKGVYSNPNEDQEDVIEAVFDSVIDFIGAANALNAAANDLLQAPPPPPENGDGGDGGGEA